MIIDTFYDYFDTIMETFIETLYIFMWIVYVNNYFFQYNKRINDLEVEIVGLRRMVYAFLDDKTQTTHFSKYYSIVPAKSKKNDTNDINANDANKVLNDRVTKLKKMILSLREELGELKTRVNNIQDDYELSDASDE